MLLPVDCIGTLSAGASTIDVRIEIDANVTTNYTWAGALGYVAALNATNGGAGFAGHNDWRLPNIRELQSIADYGRFNPGHPRHPSHDRSFSEHE